jgi:hypothetical protein
MDAEFASRYIGFCPNPAGRKDQCTARIALLARSGLDKGTFVKKPLMLLIFNFFIVIYLLHSYCGD